MNRGDFRNYRFEDLEVWKVGMEIIHETYKIVKSFPKDELFGLISQFKRAAVSIVLNIAEGSGQPTAKGFILYLRRAKSSVLECVSCVKMAIQEKFVLNEATKLLESLLEKEYFKLIALEKSIQ